MEQFKLNNKNILLTGSTGHLGEAIAFGLADAGATVFVNSRSYDRCQDLVDKLRDKGLSAENAAFDVLDLDEISNFFKMMKDKSLHSIVNNAYSGSSGTIETANEADYIQSYRMSVVATQNLLKLALPSLRKAVKEEGDASIINIASMYGVVSPDLRVYDSAQDSNPPFYGAAKAALIQWTRYAASEFGSEKIRFNAVSPGPFPSEEVQQNSPDFITALEKKVPLGRIGRPEEMQGIIIFLSSSASKYVNGTNIPVDGGWTIW